jgi:hypothetical protein
MSSMGDGNKVLQGDNYVGWFQEIETELQKAGLYEATKKESAFMQVYIKDQPVVKEQYEAQKEQRRGITMVPEEPAYPEFEEAEIQAISPVLADEDVQERERIRVARQKAAFEEAKFRYQMAMDKYKHRQSQIQKAELELKNQQVITGIIKQSIGRAVTHMSVAAKTGGEMIDLQYEYWVAHAEEHIQACRSKLEKHKYEGRGIEYHLEILLQLIEGVQVAGGSLSQAERKSYLYQSLKDEDDTFSGLDSFVATSQTLGSELDPWCESRYKQATIQQSPKGPNCKSLRLQDRADAREEQDQNVSKKEVRRKRQQTSLQLQLLRERWRDA